jgi:hypothetical protein
MENRLQKLASSTFALLAALIMLQTLYFKFSGAPESVFIFTTLGIEPFGRIGVGVLELIASILIIMPKTRVYGSILGVGLMMGAIFSHLTKLGIVVMKDGGYLFILCLVVLIGCLVCLYIEKRKIKNLIDRAIFFK